MAQLLGWRPRTSAIALALLVSWASHGPAAAQESPPPSNAPGLVDQGRRMFEGRVPLRNGGPACGACHTIATVRFPNGGTVGPDLSGVSEKFGPEGMRATLQTLFFPTMLPQYQERPLIAVEQQALAAFFAQANGASGRDRDSAVLASLAFAGFLALIAATRLTWRGRLRGVRGPLVERVDPGGAWP